MTRPLDQHHFFGGSAAWGGPASKAGSPVSSTRRKGSPMPPKQYLSRRALRLRQDESHPLYVFSLTGEELLAIAAISRVSRNDARKLIGYQRPEVKRHVQDIVSYLNGDKV